MSEGTRRRRIRASFEAGKCILPGCDRRTYGSPEDHICYVCVEGIVLRHHQRTDAMRAEWEARDAEAALHPKPEPMGHVYYVRSGGNYKIGWARDLEQRLRTKYAPDDTLLASHPGTRADEASLNRRFAHQRVAGREWYSLSVDIKQHIDSVIAEHGTPDPALRCGPKPTEVRRPNTGRNGPSPRYWTGKRTA